MNNVVRVSHYTVLRSKYWKSSLRQGYKVSASKKTYCRVFRYNQYKGRSSAYIEAVEYAKRIGSEKTKFYICDINGENNG